jgi:ankyrin repeat protein
LQEAEQKQREEEARQHQIDKLLLNACSDGDLEKAKRAIENGADVNAKDEEGWTPLHKASLCGHEAVVSLLVEKGAHVNAKDNNGMTPLHLTIFDEHEAIVSLLLENGADVNAKKNDGWSPLHYASWNGNEAIISALLENGAYVNVKAKDGSTPLHWACANRYGGKDAVVSLLLEKGADPTITNDDGKTPLQLAQKYKKQNCVAVMSNFNNDNKKKSKTNERSANDCNEKRKHYCNVNGNSNKKSRPKRNET